MRLRKSLAPKPKTGPFIENDDLALALISSACLDLIRQCLGVYLSLRFLGRVRRSGVSFLLSLEHDRSTKSFIGIESERRATAQKLCFPLPEAGASLKRA